MGDYPTKDGTAIRDFIHVVDLAKAHLAALNTNIEFKKNEIKIYNVGTGNGVTVKELVDNMIKVNNIKKLPYQIVERREGDLDIVYCEANKIERDLGWR